MVSDPKAIQHVYANPYSFTRQKHSRNLLKMLLGPGLASVDHDDHKRQRRVMQPAFGFPQLRNLFPVFIYHTQKVRPTSYDAPC
jgi:cytochrome P450